MSPAVFLAWYSRPQPFSRVPRGWRTGLKPRMNTNEHEFCNHGSTFARDAMVDGWTRIDTDQGRPDDLDQIFTPQRGINQENEGTGCNRQWPRGPPGRSNGSPAVKHTPCHFSGTDPFTAWSQPRLPPSTRTVEAVHGPLHKLRMARFRLL
jgi:hypothetical protein